MRVQYYDIKRLSEDEADALGVRFSLLRELVRTSDIVSLHVPLNASTRGMIGAGEIAQMKPTAILVNTSRGPVVDEPALTRALAAGKLFGAGLDVFDREPPPADNPLLKLDNVVLTAHFAGPTWDNHVARFRNAFDNIQRMHRGEPPLWVVPELFVSQPAAVWPKALRFGRICHDDHADTRAAAAARSCRGRWPIRFRGGGRALGSRPHPRDRGGRRRSFLGEALSGRGAGGDRARGELLA